MTLTLSVGITGIYQNKSCLHLSPVKFILYLLVHKCLILNYPPLIDFKFNMPEYLLSQAVPSAPNKYKYRN